MTDDVADDRAELEAMGVEMRIKPSERLVSVHIVARGRQIFIARQTVEHPWRRPRGATASVQRSTRALIVSVHESGCRVFKLYSSELPTTIEGLTAVLGFVEDVRRRDDE